MKKYLLIATALVALASCSDDTFVGENSPNTNDTYGGDIKFGLSMQKQTRADIYGKAAADLLGSHFYVTGTKGTEDEIFPTKELVFDNYLVHYGVNTAGTTESNTANWEYVGVVPGTAPDANYVKLSSLNAQTIKYWDFSTTQYDFLAFSTGTHKAVSTTPSTGEIGVTAMKYGEDLKTSGVAYTFTLPDVNALKNTYITDITEVMKANYGKEVQLKFKNLGSKVRIALYETVPGYSVKDVVFYKVDGTTAFTDDDDNPANDGDFKSTTAALISANASGIPTSGTIKVYFQHVGTNNDGEEDYNKASATVTAGSTSIKAPTFGTLTNFQSTEPGFYEDAGNYLGRNLPQATFAGSTDADYYTTVFPVSSSDPLTLRVDYTLVSTDGSDEEIHVYGAKAVVPSKFTNWLPNYAYTYIFKISDNTNGWTDTGATKAGLFPITFDAVVTEATDVTGEQKTITTVATPSITTYQQNHDITKNEYSKSSPADKDIYVQVMDNALASPALVGTGSSSKPLLNSTSPFTASLLYAVTSGKKYDSKPADWPNGYFTDLVCNTPASGTFSSEATYYKRCTEADVMDALENQSSVNEGNITGRNGVVLTKNTNINPGVTSIVNGVDDNPITVTEGTAAQIDISALTPGTYAYVYDYTTSAPKTTTDIYQPKAVTVDVTSVKDVKYVTYVWLKDTWDEGIATEPTHYTSSSTAEAGYLYFSITNNGGANKTYSFISVDGKIGTVLPDGLLKVPVDRLLTGGTNDKAADNTFYFDIYTRNNGAYAVKVIKVVD